MVRMRRVHILLTVVVLAAWGSPAHAQLLEFDASVFQSGSELVTEVTVGTTTTQLRFESARLQDVERQLQDILYYIRTFDAPAFENTFASFVADYAATTTPTPTPIPFTDVADFAFSLEDTRTAASPLSARAAQAAAAGGSCYTFTGSFSLGDDAPEVREVQRFLNQFAETQLADSGPGAPGEETSFFGTRTLGAVRAFQSRYALEILASVGLAAPTGFWGPSTRAQANALYGCE